MEDLLDAQYLMYKEDYVAFEMEYKDFQKRNTKRVNSLQCSVYTETATTVYMKLNRLIHSAIILYDNKVSLVGLDDYETKFMSGFKHIDNLIKHNKQPLDIADLISSTPQLQSSVLRVTRLPQLWFDVRLISMWMDLSSIPCEPRWQNQRNNYNTYLKGKMVIDTIHEMDRILRKYLDSTV